MEIKTIKQLVTYNQTIEKSKFITYLLPVTSKEELEEKILEYRNKHFDATHVCFAYVLNLDGVISFKANDDGEPQSTAGAPILNVLKSNNLENVLCIVVRYFGGIKLGAGGLVRAYGSSASLALKEASIATMKECKQYIIKFAYSYVKLMDIFLNKIDAIVLNKEYDLQVSYSIIVKEDEDIIKLKENFAFLIDVAFVTKKMIVL